ncbi:MAG: chemotaxis protein, partial [Stenotrophomonas maltophilia]
MSTASDATKTGKLRLGGSNLWLFLLLASMILFGVNTGVATWQGSRLADAGSKAADLQVLSQQLANQGRDAVGGNAQAFTAFKATRNAIEQNVSTLQGRYGKEPGVSGAIATLAETWAPLGKQAGQLVASEPAVLALAGNANNFTGAVPGLQAQLNELVRAMSASGAPSSQVYSA